VDWSHLAQDRDQWRAFLNTNESSISIRAGGGGFLDQFHCQQLLMKKSVP
jgi:hypothetical protein